MKEIEEQAGYLFYLCEIIFAPPFYPLALLFVSGITYTRLHNHLYFCEGRDMRVLACLQMCIDYTLFIFLIPVEKVLIFLCVCLWDKIINFLFIFPLLLMG